MNQELRKILKLTASYSLYYSGACAIARHRLKNRLTILTYHSFANSSPISLLNQMPAKMFDRHIKYLNKHYHMVSLSEGLGLLQNSNEIRDKRPMISITMDDGFRNNYNLAFQSLKAHSVPATLFVATDFIDNQRHPWPTEIINILKMTSKRETSFPIKLPLESEAQRGIAQRIIMDCWKSLPPDERFDLLAELGKHLEVERSCGIEPLTWDQIREMECNGIEIGSHTVFHSMLPCSDPKSATIELESSKKRIEEELSKECSLFSYPDGAWDQNAISLVSEAGYKIAVTQDWGDNAMCADPLALKRIDIPYNENLATFTCRVTKLLRPMKSFHLSNNLCAE